ncbi:MAG: hypothetical protein JRJ85_03930, partial [Deltaproteobacteria bacterium]|nr:hypothetical protein [Deltaproteobacteria bacterium]
FFMQPTWIWAANDRKGPFKKSTYDYDSNVKYVAALGANASFLMSVNPDIKTLKDCKNKKIQIDSMRGGARQITFEDIFKSEGVLDGITFQYGRAPRAMGALRDGLLDVVNGGADLFKLPGEWRVAPYMTELMATKHVYFIGIKKDWLADFKKRTGSPDSFYEIPPKMLGPTQTDKLGLLVKTSAWAVHKDMPDDVVYEFCKFLYEDIEKLTEYTPLAAALSKKTMAAMGVPESKVHPAALKFYKEKGIPIGSFHD